MVMRSAPSWGCVLDMRGCILEGLRAIVQTTSRNDCVSLCSRGILHILRRWRCVGICIKKKSHMMITQAWTSIGSSK